jgi:RNA polymerase sigma-70 factor (ECF subfamily)
MADRTLSEELQEAQKAVENPQLQEAQKAVENPQLQEAQKAVEIPQLQEAQKQAWRRYLEVVEPLRPALHGYCRRLTGSVFDAEDLVQDALIRGFATLGFYGHEVRNPRGYLLRIATNLWIDACRRDRSAPLSEASQPAGEGGAHEAAQVGDAGSFLFEHLSPQERAAVMLKDVFDLTLAEIAEVLGTSTGAVKAALHRGRRRVAEAVEEGRTARRRQGAPSQALVDQFVSAFNARDLPTLTGLLLENVSTQVFPAGLQHGRDQAAERGWLHHALFLHDDLPGSWQWQVDSQRVAPGDFEGEPVVLVFRTREGEEAMEEVWRFDEEDGRIARVRDYGFCPDAVAAVAAAGGHPHRSIGYDIVRDDCPQ